MNDYQWNKIKHLFDLRRKRKHDIRKIVEAILYVKEIGIEWRNLPASYPPWQTVFYYFDKWKWRGVWSRVESILKDCEEVAA